MKRSLSKQTKEACVTYEVVSSKELTKQSPEIFYGVHSSPFGYCVIGITKRGIARVSFMDTKSDTEARKRIKKTWPTATLVRDDKKTLPFVKKIFASKGMSSNMNVLVKGTPFQIKVWNALLAIPKGKTRTYKQLAEDIGAPKAVRAVGSACGKNSIAYLVPCHRVLASNGGIGGYEWGIERKKAMLALEASS